MTRLFQSLLFVALAAHASFASAQNFSEEVREQASIRSLTHDYSGAIGNTDDKVATFNKDEVVNKADLRILLGAF